jgi:hypothetical protein
MVAKIEEEIPSVPKPEIAQKKTVEVNHVSMDIQRIYIALLDYEPHPFLS